MHKTISMTLFLLLVSSPVFAFYQISCPAENITAINQTIKDPLYFNNLYKVSDCSVVQMPDPTPAQIATQKALMAAQLAHAQKVAPIEAQMEANRKAYIDALISGDTATQQSLAAAQATLNSQKAAIQ